MDETLSYAIPTPKDSLTALIKAFSIALSICLLLAALSWTYLSFKEPKVVSGLIPANMTPIASVSYTSAKNNDLGNYLVPLVTLPVTIGQMDQDITFLIDTGAIITALPMHYADQTGYNLAALKRLILSSLTSQTVFGYLTTMQAQLSGHTLNLPISFAPIDTPVLGRYGFLDTYSLIFDHHRQAVIIAQSSP